MALSLSLRSLFGAGIAKGQVDDDADLDDPTTQVKMSGAQPGYDPLAAVSIMEQMRNASSEGRQPNRLPLIGHLPPYVGLYGMLGDSGTSFKTAPAIGRCLAELVAQGQATTVDLTPFRPTRLAEGKPWRDAFSYGQPEAALSR